MGWFFSGPSNAEIEAFIGERLAVMFRAASSQEDAMEDGFAEFVADVGLYADRLRLSEWKRARLFAETQSALVRYGLSPKEAKFHAEVMRRTLNS